MNKIYHIIDRQSWAEAQTDGQYKAQSLDSEGFMHTSKEDQILPTLNRHYEGETGLLLLCIDEQKVDAEIKYEEVAHADEIFPHIFGCLNLDAVDRVMEIEIDKNGVFRNPLADDDR